jgi:hypothetical protein
VFAVAVVVAVACDIHAERHLAKAGGSKRKLRGIPHKRLLNEGSFSFPFGFCEALGDLIPMGESIG